MKIEAPHKHDEKLYKLKPEVGVKKLNLKPEEKKNPDEKLAKGNPRVVIDSIRFNVIFWARFFSISVHVFSKWHL